MLKIDPLMAQSPLAQPAPAEAKRDDAMLQQAKAFESVFVAQMLKHSGFEKALSSDSGFGGDSYASLLLEQYAAQIVDNGGFGLADKIYEQLITKDAGDGPDRIV